MWITTWGLNGIQFKPFDGISGAFFSLSISRDTQGTGDFAANFYGLMKQLHRNHRGYRKPYNWDLKLARMVVLRGHNS